MERVPGEIIMGLIIVIMYDYITKSTEMWENLTCEGVIKFNTETYSEPRYWLLMCRNWFTIVGSELLCFTFSSTHQSFLLFFCELCLQSWVITSALPCSLPISSHCSACLSVYLNFSWGRGRIFLFLIIKKHRNNSIKIWTFKLICNVK